MVDFFGQLSTPCGAHEYSLLLPSIFLTHTHPYTSDPTIDYLWPPAE